MIKTEIAENRQRNRGLKDYSGARFGKLVAVHLISRDISKENNHEWLFVCDCGKNKIAKIKNVRSGATSSCGCLQHDCLVNRNTTHGLTKTYKHEYRSWKDMRSRCNNPKDTDYKDYGGRGIRVCDEWNDFNKFIIDMGSKPSGYTIDRIDVNGGYSSLNCRWASQSTQANNKRNNHIIEYMGETRTLSEWGKKFKLCPSKIRYRLKMGWELDMVFSLMDFRK